MSTSLLFEDDEDDGENEKPDELHLNNEIDDELGTAIGEGEEMKPFED